MADVIAGEGAAFAVFEPFVADLVAPDFEIPDGFGDGAKILRLVDPDAAGGFG